eukprot:TRINITY_DN1350_c0_g1_i1.p1 TRINITY_DN1350_c0_g1~~TRINITY_DN1350_c0_g1_i1.p1  ORF type:complete len:242 (+),score=34.54 TRINITY_DN1350_c0_g1_i1:626-1351(+)
MRGGGVPRDVDFGGVNAIVDACKRAKTVSHLILVSAANVSRPSVWDSFVTNYMHSDVFYWKLRGENCVRRSGIPYTIVRLGKLYDGPPRPGLNSVVCGQGDELGGPLHESDAAEVLVGVLRNRSMLVKKTFEVVNASGPSVRPDDFPRMFSVLRSEVEAQTDWIYDGDAIACAVCQSSFLWPVITRHHCRCCGQVVCSGCSPHRASIPRFGYYPPTTVRICSDCEKRASSKFSPLRPIEVD